MYLRWSGYGVSTYAAFSLIYTGRLPNVTGWADDTIRLREIEQNTPIEQMRVYSYENGVNCDGPSDCTDGK